MDDWPALHTDLECAPRGDLRSTALRRSFAPWSGAVARAMGPISLTSGLTSPSLNAVAHFGVDGNATTSTVCRQRLRWMNRFAVATGGRWKDQQQSSGREPSGAADEHALPQECYDPCLAKATDLNDWADVPGTWEPGQQKHKL